MKRRVLAVAAAAATALAILPAAPAFASASASASLAADGAEVLPGAKNYSIAVRNGENPALLGGKSINAVRIILPSEVGIRTTEPVPVKDDWKVDRISASGLESYIFRAETTGLAPSATTSFPVPASVARPFRGDRSGSFQVGVSSDGGNTFRNATGTLSTLIRTLEVTSLTVTGDPRVTDGTGTAGQKITTVASVKNHAQQPQLVTAAVTSSGGSNPDSAEPAGAQSVAGGSVVDFEVPITLGAVAADTARTFTASAAAPATNSDTGTGPLRKQIPYTVQVAPTFNLTASSFEPSAVQTVESYAYKVNATKSGTPALSVSEGTVRFRRQGGTALTDAISLETAVAFGANAQSGRFVFKEAALPASTPDGKYDAVFAFTATDANGFQLTAASTDKTLTDILTIDTLPPLVTAVVQLPKDRDQAQTTAARDYAAADNNEIVVSGTSDDPASTLKSVKLECTAGTSQAIEPAAAPTVTTSSTSVSYSARFQPDFAADCPSFVPAVTFQDRALNSGDAPPGVPILVDNDIPTIEGVDGAVVRIDEVDDTKSSIQVVIDDAQNGVIGGCDPGAYSVDGQLLVQAVYINDGGTFKECTTGATRPAGSARPATNDRYLRLTTDVRRDSTLPEPTITYDPSRRGLVADRLKDAAGNYAPLGKQDTITKLVPDAPTLITVTRNAAAKEAAYNSEGTYFTRFSGKDLEVTVAGALAGDRLQLLENGEPVETVRTDEGSGTLKVDVAAVEGVTQVFGLRFLSERNIEGKVTDLKVVFDETVPTAASTVRGEGKTATVTFTESVLGSNAALNWGAFEIVEGEDGSDVRAFRGVNSVTGAGDIRTLDAEFTDGGTYGGALYKYLDGARYEDFAGNRLAETTLITSK